MEKQLFLKRAKKTTRLSAKTRWHVLFFLRQILGLQWKSEAAKREGSGRQSEDEALSVRFKGDLLSMLETFWLISQNKGKYENNHASSGTSLQS